MNHTTQNPESLSKIQLTSDLSELPDGWVWTTFGEVATISSGGTPATKYKYNFGGDIAWITPADLSNFKKKFIQRGRRNISKKGLDSSSAVLLPKGTVLLSTRAPIGYVAIAANPIATNQGFKNLILPQGIWDEYVFYYLRASKTLLEKHASGTTFLEVSASRLASVPIPLPPLSEQHRIVVRIEELFTKLDSGVGTLRKADTQFSRYKRSMLRCAFEGKLTKEWRERHRDELEPASVLIERMRHRRRDQEGRRWKQTLPVDQSEVEELPQGWALSTIGGIGRIVTGKTPSKKNEEYYGTDFPFFKPTDLNKGYRVESANDGLSILGMEKANLLPANSVLVTCIGATIGKTGLTRVQGASNQQINAIVPEKEVFPEFIYFICISPQFQKRIITDASATTLPILRKSRFEVLSFPLPPLLEQYEIVKQIEWCLSVASDVKKITDRTSQHAERLRHSVLRKAFEGKLVLQEPTDEPAEELLERIRREKAVHEAEKRCRKRQRGIYRR